MLSAMTKTKLLVGLATMLSMALLAAMPAALAAKRNPWSRIGTVHDNFNQPGLAVAANGGLHAVWVRSAADDTQDLVHTPVTLAGNVGASDAVQSGWAAMWPVPDLIATASGFRAFWGGIRSTQASETNMNVNTAAAPATGTPWTLQQGDASEGSGGYASDIGAVVGGGGTPLFAYAGTGGVFVHAGTDPATADYNVQTQLGGCCGYYPDLGYDASAGNAWVVWGSNATNRVGLYAQRVDASTGAPRGSAARLPKSATSYRGSLNFDQQITRTPVVSGAHAAYVAYTSGYPSTNRILVWKLSSAGVAAPVVVATGRDLRTPGIAADSSGRIWVTWSTSSSAVPVVHARRSNPKVTRFGASVSVSKPPAGDCQDLFELTPAAAPSRLHLVGTFESACSSTTLGLYYSQVFPGLGISASPSHIRGKSQVTFTVRDAGVAVKGARVSVAGKSDTTDGSGAATVTIGPVSKKTRYVATASHRSFVKGRTTVVVRPK